MNNFRRQQLRGFPVTFLTFLLLLVAVAFSVIGYAASDGTKQQLEAVESRYTTIGAMTDQNSSIMEHGGTDLIHTGYGPGLQEWVWVYKNYERQPDGSIVWDDGTVYHSSNVLEAVAKEAPQIRTIARSGILSAHVNGVYGVTSGAQNYQQYNRVFDNYGYNMAVMVIDELHYYEDPNDDYGSWFAHTPIQHPDGYRTYLNNSLCVGATELVSVHPRYEKLLGRNRFSGNDWDSICLLNNVEERPFKNGKRYIVRGFLDSITIVQKELDVAGVKTYTYGFYSDDVRMQYYYRPEVSGTITFDYTTSELFEVTDLSEMKGVGQENFTLDINRVVFTSGLIERKTSDYYFAPQEGSLPFYTEFEGELEDFLNSEEGQVWRDVIIPMAEINQQSATVMLVDDLDYLHAFNSGKAVIVEGRKIEASEFVRGDKVCVISNAYAEYAGLEVGDTLELDFYDTGYFLTTAEIINWDATVSEFAMSHNPLQESNRIGYREDYTIVGIYSAPEYEYGSTSFYADTIFVPKASVPNAEEYEDPSLPLLNSVVLMNGTTEAFEAHMEANGFGGYYTYFDKDYSSTVAGLEALSQNALRLLILSAAVFAVTAILFYYLNFKRMIPVAYGMRRMGQHPAKLWWQMVAVSVPLILLAVAGGAWVGMYFFDYVTERFFQANIIPDLQSVQRMALIQAAVLSVLCMLAAIPVALPRIMKRR